MNAFATLAGILVLFHQSEAHTHSESRGSKLRNVRMGGAILEKQRASLDYVEDVPLCTGFMMMDLLCIEDKYSTPIQILCVLFALAVLAAALLAKHIFGSHDKSQTDPLTTLLLQSPLVQEAMASLGVRLPESGPEIVSMQNVTAAAPCSEEPVRFQCDFADQEAESELTPLAAPLITAEDVAVHEVDLAIGGPPELMMDGEPEDLLCSINQHQDLLLLEQDMNVQEDFASDQNLI